MTFAIRDAVSEDIPEIQQIGLLADARFREVGHPELDDGTTIPTEAAERFLARGDLLVAVCRKAERLVGWVYLGRLGTACCIGQISVLPAYGRRGIGTALLEAAIARAKGKTPRASEVLLITQPDVPWNQPWYERQQFSVLPRALWSEHVAAAMAEQVAAGLDRNRVVMRRVL